MATTLTDCMLQNTNDRLEMVIERNRKRKVISRKEIIVAVESMDKIIDALNQAEQMSYDLGD